MSPLALAVDERERLVECGLILLPACHISETLPCRLCGAPATLGKNGEPITLCERHRAKVARWNAERRARRRAGIPSVSPGRPKKNPK